MERHGGKGRTGDGPAVPRARRAASAALAVLVVAALSQLTGCAGLPNGDDDVLYNAKRFDHFTCTNLTQGPIQAVVMLYLDPEAPGQAPRLLETYQTSVGPFATSGFVPVLPRDPEPGICKVSCQVTAGGQTYACDVVVPVGTTARLNSAAFWWGPGDGGWKTRRLCGEGLLYNGRVLAGAGE